MKQENTNRMRAFRRIVVPLFFFLTVLSWCLPGPFLYARQQPAFVRSEWQKTEKLWPGQRMIVDVTLYTTRSFAGDTRFTFPKASGILLLESTDRPLLGSQTIDGVEYVSKQYSLSAFPMRTGTLVLPPIDIAFGYIGEDGKPVETTAATEELTFTVEAIPGLDPNAAVITSPDLAVSDQWTPHPDQARVGDAFVRTITLQAADLPGMAFPPLNIPPTGGLGLYRNTPEIHDETQRGEFIGVRREIFTYTCEQEGVFSIPAVDLNWWNPKTEKLRRVALKEIRLDVAENPLLARNDPGKRYPAEKRYGWKTVFTALVLFTAVIAGIWLFLRRRRNRSSVPPEKTETQCFNDFRRAALADDPSGTMQALFRWLDLTGSAGKPAGISLFAHGNPELSERLAELDAVLYAAPASDPVSWSGQALFRAVAQMRKKTAVEQTSSPAGGHDLPKLNPIHSNSRHPGLPGDI